MWLEKSEVLDYLVQYRLVNDGITLSMLTQKFCEFEYPLLYTLNPFKAFRNDNSDEDIVCKLCTCHIGKKYILG